MSDDSEDSGTDATPLEKFTPPDRTMGEKEPNKEDELDDKLTHIKPRDGCGITRNRLSQSVREKRHGYLDLEDASIPRKNPLSESLIDKDRPSGPYCKMPRWYSVDSVDSEMDVIRKNMPFAGSIKRKLRRKPTTKRFDKIEEAYGNDTEEYERIRERVLQERAVVNAIEALQERWRMIMYMYHDCSELNEGRKDRENKRLTIKRQLELMCIVTVFIVMCIPLTVIMVAMCR